MHCIVWEFRVRPGCEREFERIYGPQGEWAKLMGRGAGYAGTELLRDSEKSGRYLVVDRWTTPEAWYLFKTQYSEEYSALDRRCEALTLKEERLGVFETPG